jgi:hypothetical protein
MHTLAPQSQMGYSWDEQKLEKVLVFFVHHTKTKFEVKIDSIETFDPIKIGNKNVFCYVVAKSGKKILTITEDAVEYRAADPQNFQASEVVVTSFKLKIAGIGISMIDPSPQVQMRTSWFFFPLFP